MEDKSNKQAEPEELKAVPGGEGEPGGLLLDFGKSFVRDEDLATVTVGFDFAGPVFLSFLEKFGVKVLIGRHAYRDDQCPPLSHTLV